jgi:hypothetical protein
MGFEPTIPVFQRVKTFRGLDHAATKITDIGVQKIFIVFMECHGMISKLWFGVRCVRRRELGLCFFPCRNSKFRTLWRLIPSPFFDQLTDEEKSYLDFMKVIRRHTLRAALWFGERVVSKGLDPCDSFVRTAASKKLWTLWNFWNNCKNMFLYDCFEMCLETCSHCVRHA